MLDPRLLEVRVNKCRRRLLVTLGSYTPHVFKVTAIRRKCVSAPSSIGHDSLALVTRKSGHLMTVKEDRLCFIVPLVLLFPLVINVFETIHADYSDLFVSVEVKNTDTIINDQYYLSVEIHEENCRVVLWKKQVRGGKLENEEQDYNRCDSELLQRITINVEL